VQLTNHTDYSLRVLVYLGLKDGGRATITEMAGHFGISRNHLVKVIQNLSNQRIVQTLRGKGGGVCLARQPGEINIGRVVRQSESHFNIMECFSGDRENCVISSVCKLKGVFRRAAQSFLEVLDEYTLEHILQNRDELIEIIIMGGSRPALDP